MAMQQFERWWKCNKNLPPFNMIPKPYLREGWKVALEWVLRNYPDDAIYAVIKKELLDGN